MLGCLLLACGDDSSSDGSNRTEVSGGETSSGSGGAADLGSGTHVVRVTGQREGDAAVTLDYTSDTGVTCVYSSDTDPYLQIDASDGKGSNLQLKWYGIVVGAGLRTELLTNDKVTFRLAVDMSVGSSNFSYHDANNWDKVPAPACSTSFTTFDATSLAGYLDCKGLPGDESTSPRESVKVDFRCPLKK